MVTRKLENLFNRMTIEELTAAALVLAEIATILNATISHKTYNTATTSHAKLDYERFRAVAELIPKMIKSGMKISSAINLLSQQYDIPYENIYAHWKMIRRKFLKDEYQYRQNEIMRLKNAGYSRDEIAHELKIHPNSVSRILQKIRARPADRVL